MKTIAFYFSFHEKKVIFHHALFNSLGTGARWTTPSGAGDAGYEKMMLFPWKRFLKRFVASERLCRDK